MKTSFQNLLLPLILVAGSSLAHAAGGGLTTESSGPVGEWTFLHGGQKVMVYAFAPGQPKPYVRELAPIGGKNILRDSPSDHRHHHALMYGIKVNDLNFWEETPGNGIQKVVETSKPVTTVNSSGLPQSTLRQQIHWVSPADAFLPDTTSAALLIEQRTLTLTVDETSREVALRWDSTFEVGSKAESIKLEGANYHGLGMRFEKSFDSLAHHYYQGGAPDLSNRNQDVSQHSWEAVSFDIPDHPTTITLFGLPANAAGNASYFAMKEPFAYLSATQGLDTKPITYERGAKFQLRYLITLHPEIKPAEALQKRAEKWLAENP